jgi:2-polyprenyl-6-methoxyphenol hydroxylase-like FAD-dependent oxidoreductase
MRIAIIGGGIGGLTAALALRQFGFEPRVFEQAPELLEVGAAILMWPNAMGVLDRLGVAGAVREHGGVLEKGVSLNPDGKRLYQISLPITEHPAVALHRADLQQILVHALPRESISLGHVFAGWEQQGETVFARFSDGPAIETDVLIAADGLHSRARAQLLNDGQPADRGYIAWRGVAPHAPKSLLPSTAFEVLGRGQRFGIGPLGFGKVGWWASVNQRAGHARRETDAPWLASEDPAATREQLLRLFAGWCEPVGELIRATPPTSIVRNPIFDRAPVNKWGEGSMTLLGDAIHPITPNLGQGGCLAIEDAAVLARCLDKYVNHAQPGQGSGIQPALRRFAALRSARTAAIARISRTYGVVGQWENRWAVGMRRVMLTVAPTVVVRPLLKWMFSYDAYAVGI